MHNGDFFLETYVKDQHLNLNNGHTFHAAMHCLQTCIAAWNMSPLLRFRCWFLMSVF